jgi:hypothetical protein
MCDRSSGTFDELIELGAARVARPVLQGGGDNDAASLPNQFGVAYTTVVDGPASARMVRGQMPIAWTGSACAAIR